MFRSVVPQVELKRFHLKGKHNQKTHGGNAASIPDVTDEVKHKSTGVTAKAVDYQQYSGDDWLKLDSKVDGKVWHKTDDLEVVSKGVGIDGGGTTSTPATPAPATKSNSVKLPNGSTANVISTQTIKGEVWVQTDAPGKKKWFKQSELDGDTPPATKAQELTKVEPTSTPAHAPAKSKYVEDTSRFESETVAPLHAKVVELDTTMNNASAKIRELGQAEAKERHALEDGGTLEQRKAIVAKYNELRKPYNETYRAAELQYGAAVDARNEAMAKESGKPVVTRLTIREYLKDARHFDTLDAEEQFEKDILDQTLKTGKGVWVNELGMNYETHQKTAVNQVFKDGFGYDHAKRWDFISQKPVDHDPSTGSPPTFSKWAESRSEIDALYRARDSGMTLTEYRSALDAKAKRMIDDALSTGGVYIRMKPSTIPKLHASGKMLTQHELEPNKESTEKRARAEALLFGHGEPASDHPIYGYVSSSPTARVTQGSIGGGNKKIKGDDDPTKDLDWLDGYGEVAFKVKPEVHATTTVAHGDSIDVAYRGLAQTTHNINDPKGTMFNFGVLGMTHSDRTAHSRNFNPLKYDDNVDGRISDTVSAFGGGKGYVEAQFHRPLGLSDFSEAITPRKLTKANRDLLESYGIKVTVVES